MIVLTCSSHKPGKLHAASDKVAFQKNEDIFHEMATYLKDNEAPHVLFFGASHNTHLHDFVRQGGHSDIQQGI